MVSDSVILNAARKRSHSFGAPRCVYGPEPGLVYLQTTENLGNLENKSWEVLRALRIHPLGVPIQRPALGQVHPARQCQGQGMTRAPDCTPAKLLQLVQILF